MARDLNHLPPHADFSYVVNNFDTSFVKIDQVLIILWCLKGEKHPFPLLQ